MNEGRQETGESTDQPEGVAEMSLPLLWGERSQMVEGVAMAVGWLLLWRLRKATDTEQVPKAQVRGLQVGCQAGPNQNCRNVNGQIEGTRREADT